MVFVTGGAGYIGSHTCLELLGAGHDVTVYDNFCNSQPEALDRVQSICGRTLTLIEGDLRDSARLTRALRDSGVLARLRTAPDAAAMRLIFAGETVRQAA